MKNRIAFLLSFFLATIVHSQNPQWRWATRAGGINHEEGKSIATDQDGNIYFLGNFYSPTITFGNITLSKTSFDPDIFLVKNDSSGNTIWARRIGGVLEDRGDDLAVDPNGNLLIAGSFKSDTLIIGSTILINTFAGSYKPFIAKFDSAGNGLWGDAAADGYAQDFCRGIIADLEGNIYAVGQFDSPSIAFGNIVLNNWITGLSEGYIVKYNASGNPLWARKFGDSSFDYGWAICTDNQGNAYLIGGYESDSIVFDSYTLYNNGYDDAFLVKYDSAGTVLSAKNFGGNGYEYPSGICIDASGNIYLTGGFGSTSITFGSTILNGSPGSADVFITKYDSSLNEGWIVTGAGPFYDRGIDIDCDPAGNLYACGHFNDSTTFGNVTLVAVNGTDPFMIHCDSSGNILWVISTPGNGHADAATSVAIHNGASYYTGFFQSNSITFGNFPLVNASTTFVGDVFVARLDTFQTVSINDKATNSIQNISLVPNPFSNEVLISFHASDPELTMMKIFDLNGKQVFPCENISLVKGENHFTWDASHAHAGVYLLQLASDKNLHTEKLILVK